jgi:hypothetical protein
VRKVGDWCAMAAGQVDSVVEWVGW